jgi:eukaryotic-like serine/threonine-protein kinase
MNQLLRPQQVIYTEMSRTPCRIEKFLGGGGQGEVYSADLGGSPMAVKWYFNHTATPGQRQLLEDLIVRGAPNQSFLWPMDMLSDSAVPGYGYVMPLRDSRFKGIIDLMKGQVKGITFRALTTAGYQLAESFFQLHSQGLCYRDINFNNVFFDPKTGDVLICDNDNVGVNRQASPTVLGTPRFMAPEVVRGEALPSTDTDLYSLAVLLFYMFMVHHPLEGKQEASVRIFNEAAMRKFYGTNPLFIFDPSDDSNAPDPRYHKNVLSLWPIYPTVLHEKFTQSFTEGLGDVNRRVRENEWRATLVAMRDMLYRCPHCKEEVFYESSESENSEPKPCWHCDAKLDPPIRIRLRDGKRNTDTVVAISTDTKLYRHHIDSNQRYEFSAPVAEVITHPRDPGKQGLKNLMFDKWVITNTDGELKDVEPGRSVTIAPGIKINFGGLEGELCI